MMRLFTYRDWTGLLMIVLLSLVIRLWNLSDSSLWIDEVWTDYRSQATFEEALDRILESGNQTPVYFLSTLVVPNDKPFELRFPSAILGATGVALVIWISRQLYEESLFALLGGLLLAVNPFHLWLSRTARPYPLLFVLCLLSSYFFLELLRGDRRSGIWFGLGISSALAYMTHYFAIALPISQYAMFAFILRANRRLFRQWVKLQVLCALPVLFWVFLLSRQDQVSFGIGWIPKPGPSDLLITFWNMTVGYDGEWHWFALPALVAAVAGLSLGIRTAVTNRRKDRVNFFWVLTIVGPLITAFLVSLFRPLYVDRYFVVFLPAVLLLMLWGWFQIGDRRITAVCVIVFLAGNIWTITHTFSTGQDEKEDWRGVAAYIEQGFHPEDGVLAETPIDLLAILYYVQDEDALDYSWLLDNPDVEPFLTEKAGRIWAIYRNPLEDGHIQGALPPFDPFGESNSPLDDWLREYESQIVEQRVFNGVTVVVVDWKAWPSSE